MVECFVIADETFAPLAKLNNVENRQENDQRDMLNFPMVMVD